MGGSNECCYATIWGGVWPRSRASSKFGGGPAISGRKSPQPRQAPKRKWAKLPQLQRDKRHCFRRKNVLHPQLRPRMHRVAADAGLSPENSRKPLVQKHFVSAKHLSEPEIYVARTLLSALTHVLSTGLCTAIVEKRCANEATQDTVL